MKEILGVPLASFAFNLALGLFLGCEAKAKCPEPTSVACVRVKFLEEFVPPKNTSSSKALVIAAPTKACRGRIEILSNAKNLKVGQRIMVTLNAFSKCPLVGSKLLGSLSFRCGPRDNPIDEFVIKSPTECERG
jgi:hypothetical protein